MLTGRKANHSFDYLDDDKKKNNQCVKHLKNEREQDIKYNATELIQIKTYFYLIETSHVVYNIAYSIVVPGIHTSPLVNIVMLCS